MKKVTDESFKKYGKVISNLDFSDLLEKMNATMLGKIGCSTEIEK